MARINDSYRLTPTSWKHWDPDVRFVPVRPGRTLQLMRIYSMRDLRPSDLEEFEELVAPIQAALDAGLSFMKLSGRSTKSGEFGVRPIRTVLEALESNLGRLEFDDKTPPEAIRRTFGASKNAFKLALSALYKERRVVFRNGGTQLVEKKRVSA